MHLGIFPERIEPGRPDQNGQHERMHRTRKAEATIPAEVNRAAQQRRFDEFRRVYNQERPHEALGLVPPAAKHTGSTRSLPEDLPALEYPAHFEVKFVNHSGGFRWKRQMMHVSHTLGGELIGLEPIDDGIWTIYLGPIRLGRFHERGWRVEIESGTKRHRKVSPMSSD